MKKLLGGTVLLVLVMALTLAAAASAHNRAHIILPTGECIIVGSEKSVTVPDGTLKSSLQPDGINVFLDLRPETYPADEIGTAFAADEGSSRLQKGPCP
jgi:hypothetical protein